MVSSPILRRNRGPLLPGWTTFLTRPASGRKDPPQILEFASDLGLLGYRVGDLISEHLAIALAQPVDCHAQRFLAQPEARGDFRIGGLAAFHGNGETQFEKQRA